jgi:hypothetical protein
LKFIHKTEDFVVFFQNIYKENNWYLPIIYDSDEDIIIDGYHRATALDKLGKNKILAWVGIKYN